MIRTEAHVCEQLAQGCMSSGSAGIRTCDLFVADPMPKPLCHQSTMLKSAFLMIPESDMA